MDAIRVPAAEAEVLNPNIVRFDRSKIKGRRRKDGVFMAVDPRAEAFLLPRAPNLLRNPDERASRGGKRRRSRARRCRWRSDWLTGSIVWCRHRAGLYIRLSQTRCSTLGAGRLRKSLRKTAAGDCTLRSASTFRAWRCCSHTAGRKAKAARHTPLSTALREKRDSR